MAQVHNGQPGSERQLLTQKEYADRKGWSKQYVNQLVKKGRIPLQGGKIDPVVADAALARDRDPTRAPPFRTDSMAQATPCPFHLISPGRTRDRPSLLWRICG